MSKSAANESGPTVLDLLPVQVSCCRPDPCKDLRALGILAVTSSLQKFLNFLSFFL